MKNYGKYIDIGIRHFAYCMFGVTFIIMLFAFIKGDTTGEANIGDFSTIDYNHNWRVSINEAEEQDITLPTQLECKSGDVIYMVNELPTNLADNMQLSLRTDLEDVEVYIDGELRESYTTDGFESMTYYLPSAYVFIRLNAEDAGKQVTVNLTVKKKGIIREIMIGNGNNVWFDVIKKNLPLTTLAVFIMILALIAVILYLFIRKRVDINRSIFYLGLMMGTIGIWMLSESKLRQLFFGRPSLSSYLSYLTIEMIGPLALLYFDNVQHKKYRRIYRILQLITCGQVAVNIVLSLVNIAPLTETLKFSHIDVLIGIIIILFNVGRDIRSKEVLNYKIVASGIALFLFFAVGEIYNYYASNVIGYGTFLCVGLILLLFTTAMQIVSDSLEEFSNHERKQQESWVNTIETIASTIDAKDEYTGGHSNRVSEYAGILARGMAADYDFSEEDIVRIRYIGLMHDIGKIGVADTILNKTGRLTDEEFTLMKKHVEIGDSLLKSMDGNMEGLLDGVRYHHERFDGKGYPSGLEGTDIPLIARILCIADCYDAMTSNRVYRRRLTDEAVREEFVKCAGTQFDPALVDIFVDLLDKGDISPMTVDGMEVDEGGNVRKSSVLEHMLQDDIKKGEEIIENPSHIRMACYIMKLAEYRNQTFDGYIVAPKKAEDVEEMENLLKKHIQSRDININYSDNKKLVAFFGRTDKELGEIRCSLAEKLIIKKL